MKLTRSTFLVLLTIVVLLGVAAWFWRSSQGALEDDAIDLIALFPDAEKRTTMSSLEEGYAIQTVVIDGDRRQSLFAHPFSRVTWTVTVPPRAVLRTAAALRPDVWTSEGDGALFRIGVSDGQTYTEFYKQRVQPSQRPEDRRWFPIEIDLSPFAGQSIQIIFNTEPGESGNAVGDAAVWGTPRIVPNAAGNE